MIPMPLYAVLRRQRYQIVGRHSVVKPCHWMRESLKTNGKRFCYKQKFYGIKSLLCLQMSPSAIWCTQSCLFCWRVQPGDVGLRWNQTFMGEDVDDPAFIVEESIRAQRRVLVGYKGDPRVKSETIMKAWNPKHAAISLVGEPTLYPKIGELIQEFHRRKFTTFLVTNGTLPERLSSLDEEPTQLYVSVTAPNEEVYRKTCRPLISDGWSRLNETLELLHSFNCPTVMRITLAKNLNMIYPEGYAKLILKAEPTYVEPKGAMWLGYSTKRIPKGSMPRHSEIMEFAERLSELTGYKIIDESLHSRIALLSRLDRPIKLG